VIKPTFMDWRNEYLVALAGAALNAGSMVATKALERQDSTMTIMAWLTVLSSLATPNVASLKLIKFESNSE
jgi:cytochrome c-type biogenesis protein CcmH/NrfG